MGFVGLVGHFPTHTKKVSPAIFYAGLDKRPTKTTKTTEGRALSVGDKGVLEGLKRPLQTQLTAVDSPSASLASRRLCILQKGRGRLSKAVLFERLSFRAGFLSAP